MDNKKSSERIIRVAKRLVAVPRITQEAIDILEEIVGKDKIRKFSSTVKRLIAFQEAKFLNEGFGEIAIDSLKKKYRYNPELIDKWTKYFKKFAWSKPFFYYIKKMSRDVDTIRSLSDDLATVVIEQNVIPKQVKGFDFEKKKEEEWSNLWATKARWLVKNMVKERIREQKKREKTILYETADIEGRSEYLINLLEAKDVDKFWKKYYPVARDWLKKQSKGELLADVFDKFVEEEILGSTKRKRERTDEIATRYNINEAEVGRNIEKVKKMLRNVISPSGELRSSLLRKMKIASGDGYMSAIDAVIELGEKRKKKKSDLNRQVDEDIAKHLLDESDVPLGDDGVSNNIRIQNPTVNNTRVQPILQY